MRLLGLIAGVAIAVNVSLLVGTAIVSVVALSFLLSAYRRYRVGY